MVACRAIQGRFVARMQVSAVAALPNLRSISFEDPAGVDIGCQFQIPFFMLLFSNRNGLKNNCDIAKSFFHCDVGKPGIHFRNSIGRRRIILQYSFHQPFLM